MSHLYSMYFTKNEIPVTGLAPTITLYKSLIDNSDLTPPSVSEVGDGYYKFSVVVTVPAVMKVDSGDTDMTPSERYRTFHVDPSDAYLNDLISNVRSDIASLSGDVDSLVINVGNAKTSLDTLTNVGITGVV